MYAQAIGVAARMAARKAKEIWWQKLLKELVPVAVKESSKEGIRWFASRGARSNNKPLQKKLEELNRMHKDGLITSEEHAALRKRIIDAAGPKDI
jgi:hypothetical protein